MLDYEAEQTKTNQQAEKHATEQQLLESIREEQHALRDVQRQQKRDEGVTLAQQANTGLAGISQQRVLNNVLFQSTLDKSEVMRSADAQRRDIAVQGFSAQNQIQNTLNKIRAERSMLKKESWGSIGLKAGIAGATSYAGASASSAKPKSGYSSGSSSAGNPFDGFSLGGKE